MARYLVLRLVPTGSRKGADLIGQRVTSHKDLATLAAVLRDPRAETFRYFLVKNGEIVYHTAVTSRMTSSSAAFVGSAGDFMNQIKATMERIGADGYYLLHNHPSGITQASEADVKLTRDVSAAIPGFLGHVILDHTEYGLIDTENPTGEAGRSFQSFKGSFPLDVTGPDPTRTGGTIPHPALGTSISSPSLFAEMANGLRDASNVVMVATDAQLRVTGIMEVPAEHMKRGKLTAFKHMARLRKVAGADYEASSIADVMDKVRDALGEAPKAKRMEFEVRGQPGRYAINKKGDKLYRKVTTTSPTTRRTTTSILGKTTVRKSLHVNLRKL
ncbi:MAG: hypothetical protein IPJ52_01955 [Rhodocyclaceae bacterium]|nr:hypothetical protein [Rhodocyclaceae bacterium]